VTATPGLRLEVPAELADLFAEAERRLTGGARGVAVRPPAPGDLDEIVDVLAAAAAPVVLAGPGVVADDAVTGLRAFAAAGNVGVLNTWGAKGVFDWRSPHHLATAGLQARDFELGGLADADLIITTGLDEREAPGWRLAPAVDVPPAWLGPLSHRWTPPASPIEVPVLRAELARVTQAGWVRAEAPLAPTRVTRHYAEVLGADGLVVADPGIAGYWIARTFATTAVGGALVPADPDVHGFAVAAAIVARLLDPDRAVLAVVDVVHEVHERLLDVAARLGVVVALEVWAEEGDVSGAHTHRRRLSDLVVTGGVSTLATDERQLEEMEAVAGPIVAWRDRDDRSSCQRGAFGRFSVEQL
jgi:hypothetical protein